MSESSPYQERYWKELFELRVHVNYIEKYMQQSEFRDKTINIFLAVTSSGSICGWAIWNKYSFIWAVIIAVSQVINVVKQFLPYKMRLKTTGSISKELEELLDSYEAKWFDVERSALKEGEINKLQFEIRSAKTKIVHKHLGKNTLPDKGRLLRKAKQRAEVYIKNHYGEKKMSDQNERPQPPEPQPSQPQPPQPQPPQPQPPQPREPSEPLQEERAGLPPVDDTPVMPPVKPPKDE